jgi:hypothetical protein
LAVVVSVGVMGVFIVAVVAAALVVIAVAAGVVTEVVIAALVSAVVVAAAVDAGVVVVAVVVEKMVVVAVVVAALVVASVIAAVVVAAVVILAEVVWAVVTFVVVSPSEVHVTLSAGSQCDPPNSNPSGHVSVLVRIPFLQTTNFLQPVPAFTDRKKGSGLHSGSVSASTTVDRSRRRGRRMPTMDVFRLLRLLMNAMEKFPDAWDEITFIRCEVPICPSSCLPCFLHIILCRYGLFLLCGAIEQYGMVLFQ